MITDVTTINLKFLFISSRYDVLTFCIEVMTILEIKQICEKKIDNHCLGKLQNLWNGWGRHIPQILISLANDLICANDFIRVLYFS